MRLPYYQVDAFTNRVFTGNPAGVCLLPDWIENPRLQSIAAENNQSETAFLVRRDDSFNLRWFTPTQEVDLCGHATLAAAKVLFDHEGESGNLLRFDTRSGILTVAREGDRLILDFPARPAEPCEPPSDLIRGLGTAPLWVGKARDYLAIFESEDEVANLRPDFAALARLDALGIIASAPGTQSDFVSRFFAPGVGIPEDPVTGSAHCTLVPYWAKQLGRTKCHARQISARSGELFCELNGDRVKIGGTAVTYLTGSITIPPA